MLDTLLNIDHLDNSRRRLLENGPGLPTSYGSLIVEHLAFPFAIIGALLGVGYSASLSTTNMELLIWTIPVAITGAISGMLIATMVMFCILTIFVIGQIFYNMYQSFANRTRARN